MVDHGRRIMNTFHCQQRTGLRRSQSDYLSTLTNRISTPPTPSLKLAQAGEGACYIALRIEIAQNSAKAHVNPAIATTSAQALTATPPPTFTPFAPFWTCSGVALLAVAETTPELVVRSDVAVSCCEIVAIPMGSGVLGLIPDSSRVSVKSEVADVGR